MSTLNVLWKIYLYPPSNSIKSSSHQITVSGQNLWTDPHTVSISRLVVNIPRKLYKKNEVSSDAVCESEGYVDVCPGASEDMIQWRKIKLAFQKFSI